MMVPDCDWFYPVLQYHVERPSFHDQHAGCTGIQINFWQKGWAITNEIDQMHLSGEIFELADWSYTRVIPARDAVRVHIRHIVFVPSC